MEVLPALRDIAPTTLTYRAIPAVYTRTLLAPNMPASRGGGGLTFSVAPALPAGLTLDAAPGVVTGNAHDHRSLRELSHQGDRRWRVRHGDSESHAE